MYTSRGRGGGLFSETKRLDEDVKVFAGRGGGFLRERKRGYWGQEGRFFNVPG